MLVETIGTIEKTINLENFTDDDLNTLYEKILNEKGARKAKKRMELINNFEEALSALHDAHIDVSVEYTCGDCGYQDVHYIYLDNINYY